MPTLQPARPLINLFRPGQEVAENALNANISWEAIASYEGVRTCKLGAEQTHVCNNMHTSDLSLFYIHALASVGKASLINMILYGAAMTYKGRAHKRTVVLVLVPNRALKRDFCQDVINTSIFDNTEVLWLGRPPPGRTDGLLCERLADSMRELQRETWQKLDGLIAQR